MNREIIPRETIERRIFLIRGKKVMLDSDLAELYSVPTKRLNEQVRRNSVRFPEDFMFELTKDEARVLRSHFATSKKGRGGRRYRPYAFTEQGVAMLSTVLKSEQAIKINIEIMRAFVQLRYLLSSNADLKRKVEAIELKYDAQFAIVFDELRHLKVPPLRKKRPIGFRSSGE